MLRLLRQTKDGYAGLVICGDSAMQEYFEDLRRHIQSRKNLRIAAFLCMVDSPRYQLLCVLQLDDALIVLTDFLALRSHQPLLSVVKGVLANDVYASSYVRPVVN